VAGASDVGGSPALSKVDARKALGLPVEGWLLLLVGHNFEKKGLAAVLRSLALLPPDVFLLVVGGDAEQADTWSTRCAQLRLDRRVVFSGSLPDAAPAFAAADCLVHATLDDMFPLVVLEAMAASVPVVLSVAPYCVAAPLMQKASAAWMLQDPHAEQQIADAVGALRADLDLRQAQIAHASEFVQNHAWPQIGMQQAQGYRHLLSAQGLSN
jgi:UDP-glucose:(heptosyl)LPS alpha-1,3-glucosyltransferase